MTIERAQGHQFLWNNRWFVTAINHASFLSRERDVEMERQWRDGVGQFVMRVEHGVTWDAFPRKCLFCTDSYYSADEDGVGVCKKHMKENFGKALAARKKSKEMIGQHNQGGML